MKTIFIVQGSITSNNRREFLGASDSYKDSFKITKKHSNSIYEYFIVNEYDVINQKYISADTIISLNQKYSEDGHLEPKEDRNEDGFCHTGFWGPYCHECRDIKSKQLSQSLLKKPKS
jgi:hypothetical protein